MITCEKRVKRLIRKYNTRNPYEIAERLGITIKCDYYSPNLPSAFFKRILKRKFIIINLDRIQDDNDIRNALAHELGHAVLHCTNNLMFLHEHSLCNRSILEKQANEFAAELLIDLEQLDNDINSYTYFEIANYFNVPVELAKLKLHIPY